MKDVEEMLALLNKAWEAKPELGLWGVHLEESDDGATWRFVPWDNGSGHPRCPLMIAERAACVCASRWVRAAFFVPSAPSTSRDDVFYVPLRQVSPPEMTPALIQRAELSARTAHPAYCAVFMLVLEERRGRDKDFSIELDEHLHNPAEGLGL